MLMNSPERQAQLRYEPNGFRMVSPGTFVVCAVTAEKIPLDALRYWSAVHQEAYATPEAATKRLMPR
jgi:hypothetical protein